MKPSNDDSVKGCPDTLSIYRDEVQRASQYYYYSPLQMGVDRKTKQFVIESCIPFIKGSHVLDLGYVDGTWTDEVLHLGFSVDIVEGASSHVERARQKYADTVSVRIFESLFQEYIPDCRYNTIIAGDMIRYLRDPREFLSKSRQWLEKDGHLIATVPNSRSLHRRVGALMGMEPTPTVSNQRDKEVGNQRSYDRYEFRYLLMASGYNVKTLHGCFLKPLSSEQMSGWSDDLLRAFLKIGTELEDYCWFIYAICTK